MSKTSIIALVLAAFIIAAIIIITSITNIDSNIPAENVTSSPPHQTTSQNNPTISYNATGFSPNSLTIEKGTTVLFKNDGGPSMWVATDPHPVHTNFPSFDAKRGYQSGQSYTFTFEQSGTYSYHNHLKPSDRGTVIVE